MRETSPLDPFLAQQLAHGRYPIQGTLTPTLRRVRPEASREG